MTSISSLLRVIILWIVLIICMILHFNYHVSKIFYGINVVRPSADGTIPLMAQLLKNVYFHLPMIFVVALLYIKGYWFRLCMLLISVLYSMSHVAHVVEEYMKPTLDYAQIPLLSLTLLFSLLLNKASWDYFTQNRLSHV